MKQKYERRARLPCLQDVHIQAGGYLEVAGPNSGWQAEIGEGSHLLGSAIVRRDPEDHGRMTTPRLVFPYDRANIQLPFAMTSPSRDGVIDVRTNDWQRDQIDPTQDSMAVPNLYRRCPS